MVKCQIQAAARHAFPPGATAVVDRSMSLNTVCREDATYSAKLGGSSTGKARQGAPVKEFLLCENHSQLVSQVDADLKDDGWSSALVERPHTLA